MYDLQELSFFGRNTESAVGYWLRFILKTKRVNQKKNIQELLRVVVYFDGESVLVCFILYIYIYMRWEHISRSAH